MVIKCSSYVHRFLRRNKNQPKRPQKPAPGTNNYYSNKNGTLEFCMLFQHLPCCEEWWRFLHNFTYLNILGYKWDSEKQNYHFQAKHATVRECKYTMWKEYWSPTVFIICFSLSIVLADCLGTEIQVKCLPIPVAVLLENMSLFF